MSDKKKRKPLAETVKTPDKPSIDPKELDEVVNTVHAKEAEKQPMKPLDLTRLTADIDSEVFSAMKVHCAKTKGLKVRNYIEGLIRKDLEL